MKQYYVYIMASDQMGTLYIGVTSNLTRRVYEHKNKLIEEFTSKYDIDKLVHYEIFDEPGLAIAREKKLKKWNRNWKLKLIIDHNPDWVDLYSVITA